ncbi:hypothetical protein COHA_009386 [Chlorella ohadii]|uniref:Reticulon-like protein n=1 Tax=Chlorella ohadii TaxID=2649997 RepID=A0AAD5H0N8_9CHLO|nr:hypothetical protein COHA_009386 [Chlorella ohadii]
MSTSTTSPSGRVRLPVKDPRVQELLLWTNPRNSAIAVGGVTAVYAALQYGSVNPLQTSAYVGLVLVLGCFLWNNIASFTHRPPVPVPRLLKEGVSEGQAKDYAAKATVHVNKGLSFAHRLATGREPVLTGTVAGALYAVGRLAGLLSLLSLAYAAVLAAFVVPKVYELKKDEIDGALDKARAQVTALNDKYLSKVMAKIPRHTPAKPAESSSERKEE